ncbi:MAG: hypothetical protein KDE51_12225, partial [Anaerolineales bacterium]|nr:hypothetical protein [Anaerolineales bacterium]
MLVKFPFCDQSVNHAAAVFYGAQGCNYLLRDRLLPLTILREQIIQPYQDKLAAEQEAREQAQQARLAQHTLTTTASSGQIERYVEQVIENICDDVGRAVAGMGLRHQNLFTAALQLGSLKAADWLTAAAQTQLQQAEDLLFDAAVANGYVADYGEDSALRTIDNGVDIGLLRPREEPLWYEQETFFELGDLVEAQTAYGTIRGRIKRFRNEHGSWEFLLDSKRHTWFDKSLLKPMSEALEPLQTDNQPHKQDDNN